MTTPIPVRVTRYQCPYCPRGHSTKTRCREHMARCWHNPDAHGCKTCRHFEYVDGYGGGYAEECALGVDLTGHPACSACGGFGWAPTNLGGQKPCGPDVSLSHIGDGSEVKAGPIVHCERWEASDAPA